MKNNSILEGVGNSLKFVGLDVHKDTIAVAVADLGIGEPRSLGIIRNDHDALRALLRKLGRPSQLRVCYEAGPCGYVVYRFLQRLKIDCVIMAPSLIPRKPGDRVKTDRRDASSLARLLRSGELTPTWVPDHEHEALRDVVRAREDSIEDQLRARNRLTKFLLRLGIKPPEGVKAWSQPYRKWLGGLTCDKAAQQLVFHRVPPQPRRDRTAGNAARTRDRGMHPSFGSCTNGRCLASDARHKARYSRYHRERIGGHQSPNSPRELMAYAGMVPSEHSSGKHIRRGSITKTGNAQLRRVIVETAWHYRHQPGISDNLRRRQRDVPAPACSIAWNAQQRLNKRYRHLLARGKTSHQTVVAVGRQGDPRERSSRGYQRIWTIS